MMFAIVRNSTSDFVAKTRNLFFVLLGVAVFLLKRSYAGPLQEAVHAYAGNVSVSFALYFNLSNLPLPVRFKKLLVATLTFAAVESFEVFDGFGVMSNTYDPLDLVANAVGIALAFGLDTMVSSKSIKDPNKESS
jgi:hypothetical protein